jgi:hypothetical protein|tara:strand:- start:244 stop:468 length:225 start_codon:yes stop_codon:yes gene_type:complete
MLRKIISRFVVNQKNKGIPWREKYETRDFGKQIIKTQDESMKPTDLVKYVPYVKYAPYVSYKNMILKKYINNNK